MWTQEDEVKFQEMNKRREKYKEGEAKIDDLCNLIKQAWKDGCVIDFETSLEPLTYRIGKFPLRTDFTVKWSRMS